MSVLQGSNINRVHTKRDLSDVSTVAVHTKLGLSDVSTVTEFTLS